MSFVHSKIDERTHRLKLLSNTSLIQFSTTPVNSHLILAVSPGSNKNLRAPAFVLQMFSMSHVCAGTKI